MFKYAAVTSSGIYIISKDESFIFLFDYNKLKSLLLNNCKKENIINNINDKRDSTLEGL